MEVPRLNRPLWLENAGVRYPQLDGVVDVDVAVIGAGITGVTTAYLLKAEGRSVALLESSAVCHGATGYTTAKLTVGHNLVYRDLIDSHGVETARAYARSNQRAIERVATLVHDHGIDCDFERASNYVYTESAGSVRDIEREAQAARDAGVAAELTTETDLPYAVRAAVRVDEQAQFHPWKYVAALAQLVSGNGSHVFESTRATDVQSGDPCVVETRSGTVRARHVIVATQLPFLDRGLFFAKAHPSMSYVVAASVDEDRAPRGMYISVDRPTRPFGRHQAPTAGVFCSWAAKVTSRVPSPTRTSATAGSSASCRSDSALTRRSTTGRHTTSPRSTACRTSAACHPETTACWSPPATRNGE